MQNEKVCYLTGLTNNLDKHHIFNGAKRRWADKNGCWVWLDHDIHMWMHQTSAGRMYWYSLKAECQKAWEQLHAEDYDHLRYTSAHDQFIHEVGKSYEQYL